MSKTWSKKSVQVVTCVMFLAILSACGQTQPPATPTQTSTPPPAATNTPVPTSTNTPAPTPIPGSQVYPLSSLGTGIPWLAQDKANIPMSVFYGFNIDRPPFNNVLVRKAFAASVDKDEIVKQAIHFKFQNIAHAMTLTPPEILGRDLYGDVGIPFDPARAKEYLQQAGYTNMESFPSVTLLVYTRGEAAPGGYYRIAKTIAGMWETHLGVKVNVDASGSIGDYMNRLQNNPPELYGLGWGADYNDPDNFLKDLFHSGSEFNYAHFNNKKFDSLVDEAANLSDPAERQLLYIQAEQILSEQEVVIIPLFHTLYYAHP